MIKHLPIIFLCIFLAGCQSNRKTDISELLSKLSRQQNLNFKSMGKGRGKDLIDELFKEALDKDGDLEDLYNEILEVRTQTKRKLRPYRAYQNIQESYIHSMEGHIQQMQDSTLKQEASKNLKRLERLFSREKDAYNTLEYRIQGKRKYLQDLTTLMKFQVTEKLMYDHFAQKRPNPQDIQDVESKLNSLQKKVKKRIKP